MSDPVAPSSDITAQRLAEAPIIENEWNNMSYKDRAAWWMSAKWYGYMSTEAYRRGDALNTEISCRYGEPGFFIATRVPYYEAQAAVSTIVASTTTTAVETETTTETAATSEPAVATTETPVVTSEESKPAAPETAADEAATIIREAITNSVVSETTTLAATSNTSHKKKKKKHHNKPTNPSEGKTIEIRLGGQSVVR